MLRNGAQVGMLIGAPQQYRGDQGIHGGFRGIHLPHQLEAHAALLKPAVPETPEGHAGK